MSNPTDTNGPIFIVGMNGSGTTMLLNCLDNHSDIYGFRRETKIIPYFIRSSIKYGDLSLDENFRKLWEAFLDTSFFKYVNDGEKVPLPENWKDMPRSVASVIDGTFSYFAAKEGKSRWCEKTPMNAQHITLLAKTFPGAKFIHIIRDGRACAASFHRRWGYKPALTIYRWKQIVREAQSQGAALPDRYFELHYEDLTEDPEVWLRYICSFLNVPYEPRIVSLSHISNYSGSSDKVITKREEYWREYFTEDEIDYFDKVAGGLIHRLGYLTTNPNGDEDPGALQVKYWKFIGNMNLARMVIRNEWKYRKNSGKWDDFSGKFINAIRQRLTSRY